MYHNASMLLVTCISGSKDEFLLSYYYVSITATNHHRDHIVYYYGMLTTFGKYCNILINNYSRSPTSDTILLRIWHYDLQYT